MIGFYAGSFDPLTIGHMDVIRQAAGLFDHLFVTVGTNGSKQPWFTAEERVAMIVESLVDYPVFGYASGKTVSVSRFDGLLIDHVAAQLSKMADDQKSYFVRGLRTEADFTYEMQMAQANKALSGISTVFIPASPSIGYVSSTLVRELARFGFDKEKYAQFVPPPVADAIHKKRTEQ